MNKIKLSVVLATRNEEENIARCLISVKNIADEIIVFDEYSKDNTKEIAERYGAKVFLEPHHEIFHITKQKAVDAARGEWILQMDADEVITPELSKEISAVVSGSPLVIKDDKKTKLFARHQVLIEERDGQIGDPTGEIVAYFIPRRNIFLGKPLIHAGVYPDPAIRLFKKGKAWFPAKSVHEIMKIEGKISWLYNDMEHYDSPTLKRYLWRLNRYTDLQSVELKDGNTSKGVAGFIKYVLIKPLFTFFNLLIRHKGVLDGVNGFLWSFFSSLHYPIAYFKYLTN